eukprot:745406-Pelagomonas_calceolata.AAC.3
MVAIEVLIELVCSNSAPSLPTSALTASLPQKKTVTTGSKDFAALELSVGPTDAVEVLEHHFA